MAKSKFYLTSEAMASKFELSEGALIEIGCQLEYEVSQYKELFNRSTCAFERAEISKRITATLRAVSEVDRELKS